MDIYKLIGVGIVGTIIVSLLKHLKSELAIYATVATGIVMLVYIVGSLVDVVDVFNGIVDKTGLDGSLFAGILKIIGIGYITEYSAGLCSDADGGSIASKILLGGKIAIFLMSLPILNKLVEIVIGLVP